MPSDLAVRLADASDVPWLQALAREPTTARVLAVGAAERFDDLVAADELHVAELHDVRVGGFAIHVRNHRSRVGEINTLMIDLAHRGTGLGVATVQAACVRLFETGMYRIEAETYAFNQAAQRTFEAAGFTLEGRRRRAYDRHGERHDGVIYGLLANELH